MFRSFAIPIACFLLMPIALGFTTTNQAQEFRIDTDIYADKHSKPIAHNITVFDGEMIYDFQMSNDPKMDAKEIVIFDGRTRALVLLDMQRKIKLTIQQQQLLEIVEGSRKDTAQKKETSFLVTDKFTENYEQSTGWVTLKSPHFKYEFKGSQPKNAQVLPKYAEFLNQFTRLSATHPQALPPFARLKVNESIKKFGWVPQEIKVTLKKPKAKTPIVRTSRHTLLDRLSDQDQERIAAAKKSWITFPAVSLARYREIPQAAQSPPTNRTNRTKKPTAGTFTKQTNRQAATSEAGSSKR